MSQAEKPNTTNLSRRSALAGLAGAAAAGITPAIARAAEVDPIFAVIAEHRAAVEAWCRAIESDAAESVTDAAVDRGDDAHWEVLTTQPTTLAGVAALLAHVGQPQFLGTIEVDHETMLSIFIQNGQECGFKRAAQDFPARLAETVRSLIGGQS